MSSALAIASVTAVLKNLLIDGVIDQDLTSSVGDVTVSALPPDRVTTGDLEKSQLNLFLFQVTPNQGWRNVGLPSRGNAGESISAPPLALDLHYLLTAYGASDFHAEILLGYAMQLLHEMPVLSRKQIRFALDPATLVASGGGLPATLRALSTSRLADQIEQIKITPQSLNTEDTLKLWTALQARYRATAAYQVSVVLIDNRQPVRPGLPVLRRGEQDRGVDAQAGASLPRRGDLRLPNGQSSALLGDRIVLNGENLDGFVGVRFTHPRLPETFDLLPTVDEHTGDFELTLEGKTTVTLPDKSKMPAWLSGPWRAALVVARNEKQWTSDPWHFSVAPRIESVMASPPSDEGDIRTVQLTVKCSPPVKLAHDQNLSVRFDQQIELLLGNLPAMSPAPPSAATPATEYVTDTLVFPLVFLLTSVKAGTYTPRLRVDGIEMALVDWTKTPPEFDPRNSVTLP